MCQILTLGDALGFELWRFVCLMLTLIFLIFDIWEYMRGCRSWEVSHLFRREISCRIDSKSSLGTLGARDTDGRMVLVPICDSLNWLCYLKIKSKWESEIWFGRHATWRHFRIQKRSATHGLPRRVYTWWATHGGLHMVFFSFHFWRMSAAKPCVAHHV